MCFPFMFDANYNELIHIVLSVVERRQICDFCQLMKYPPVWRL